MVSLVLAAEIQVQLSNMLYCYEDLSLTIVVTLSILLQVPKITERIS